LLIDGMKDPSQYDRDSFNYDRIEVMRGSASMLFGRGSTGGVINQVTKKPALVDQSDVVTTIGTGRYLRLTADTNVRTGENSAFRLNAMATKADNYGAKIDKRGIAPSYSWGIDTPNEVTVAAYYLDVDNVPMSGLRYLRGGIAPSIPARNFYGTKSDYLTGEATFGSASWRHKLAGGGEIRSQVRTGVFRRSSWGTVAGYCSMPLTATGICPDGSFPVTRDTLDDATPMTRIGLAPRKDRYRATYLQSDYSKTFGWFGLRHEVLAGVDLSFESVDRYSSFGRVTTNYNKGGTRVGTPNDGTRTASVPVYRPSSDYQANAVGLYVQDLLALNDRWKLLGGLRIDRFKASNSQTEYAPNGNIVATPSSELLYDALWSQRFGVLYQPSSSRSYHFSYGTSFNTSADTYQFTTQAVANVPAERSRNIELGAKHDWFNGTLSTRIALFRTDKYNERTTDVNFAGTSYTLSGQRHSQGIDLDVIGWLTPDIEIYASYTWLQRARIDKAGVVLNNEGAATTATGQTVGLSPRHSGAIWLGYKATPALRLGIGARGVSENRPLQGGSGAAATNAKTPGYVAYDAMAEYTFTPDVYLQLNLTNLTNKVYGDQLYPTFYTPGEGRSAKLSLGVRF
ncbi:MAG: TonB-dependent receptor, partial [Lautropia sp.]